MTDNSPTPRTLKGLLRWAMTPPQAWGVYLLAVLLVWLIPGVVAANLYAGLARRYLTRTG